MTVSVPVHAHVHVHVCACACACACESILELAVDVSCEALFPLLEEARAGAGVDHESLRMRRGKNRTYRDFSWAHSHTSLPQARGLHTIDAAYLNNC